MKGEKKMPFVRNPVGPITGSGCGRGLGRAQHDLPGNIERESGRARRIRVLDKSQRPKQKGLAEGFRIRIVLVWACVRKGSAFFSVSAPATAFQERDQRQWALLWARTGESGLTG